MVKCGLCKIDKPFLLKLPVTFDDGKREQKKIQIGYGQKSVCVDCLKSEMKEVI